MPPLLPTPVIAAFTALTLALASLWLSRVSALPLAARAWMPLGALALILALVGRLIDLGGLLVLLSFALASRAARQAVDAPMKIVSHAIVLILGAGLFLHVMPGIYNPRVLSEVVPGPDAAPYTKYLNFDKGIAGLVLLGVYAPDLPAGDEGGRRLGGIAWRFAIVAGAVIALSLGVGYVRWDPKLPSWWAMWVWSMVFLTALPEEAAFRGVVQTAIARRLGDTPRALAVATLTAGCIFGLAHLSGGPMYVALASVAGIGYGWVYASTRSIAAAIVTHTGLNALHLFLFTYPALLN